MSTKNKLQKHNKERLIEDETTEKLAGEVADNNAIMLTDYLHAG